ncbi:hypothetical protein [Vibrio coralliilyticus]|uniref:hypothetical protein n=1 Tax=Vibrio coralliilyticus TaxID=190893 RepID=UPI00301C04DA
MQLTFLDGQGKEHTFKKFKLDTYPLKDAELGDYDHRVRCTATGKLVEIIEMVKKNEA